MIQSQRHSYHLVHLSPWPILGSLGALATIVGGVMYMHSFQGGAKLLSLGLIFILYIMFVWWHDVLRESTLEGHHMWYSPMSWSSDQGASCCFEVATWYLHFVDVVRLFPFVSIYWWGGI